MATKRERTLVALFCIAALTLKSAMSLRAPVGPDEFQHLHGAWCVAVGQVPYQDFFEHHPPFIYYLLLPLFRIIEPGFGLILAARAVMLALNVVVLWLTYRLATLSMGKRTAVFAVLFLLSEVLFFEYGFWVLTDLPAVLLTLSSAVCLVHAGRSHRAGWFFCASVCLGSAVLFTPKIIYCGAGVALWFAVYLWAARDGSERFRRLARAGSFLAGGLVPLGLLLLLMGVEALPKFWEQNVVLNLHWKARHSALPHIRHMLVTNGPLWVAAVIGTVWTLIRMLRLETSRQSRQHPSPPSPLPSRRGDRGEGVRGVVAGVGISEQSLRLPEFWWRAAPVTLTLLSLALGAAMLPVVWVEYFVGVAPYGAILAGYGLRCVVGALAAPRLVTRRRLATAGIAALFLLAPLTFNFIRALDQMAVQRAAIARALAMVAACVTVLSVRQARYSFTGLAALSVFLALPMLAQCELTSNASNDDHRAGIAYVMEHTRPNDAVFDGYMGYGLFRPHSYWWWFLHDEVQLMLSANDKGEAIVQALERVRPPVVLYDCWVEALEPVVHEYIRAHYEPTQLSQIWVRKTK